MYNPIQKWKEEKERKIREKLEEQIIRSEQVRNFFSTDTGKYLEARIAQDIQSVKDRLVKVDHRDSNAIQDLQNEYLAINKIKFYFAQALLDGSNAEKALNLNSSYEQEE